MNSSKAKSFTLSELLVAMIITVILVGMAFTVLNLVKKQINTIEKNYKKSTEFSFFKQRIWLDFNKNNYLLYNSDKHQLVLKSELDSVYYTFNDDYILRNKDTLKSSIRVEKLFFQTNEVKTGSIDAISFIFNKNGLDSLFFVFKKNDATQFMNQDGF